MSDFSTNAILLRKIEYGDYDLIITFLSKLKGKITVIAKNAKKSVRRFGGALEPFSIMDIQCSFSPKNKNSLPYLNNIYLYNPFMGIRADAAKIGYASYWSEVVNSWLESDTQQISLYNLLYYALESLDANIIKQEVLSILFQIRAMNIFGFSPIINYCSSCNTYIDDIKQKNLIFDFKEGNILCDKCINTNIQYSMLLNKGTLKQLEWVTKNNISKADRIHFSSQGIKESEAFLERFMSFYIGREFKSLIYLRRIREEY